MQVDPIPSTQKCGIQTNLPNVLLGNIKTCVNCASKPLNNSDSRDCNQETTFGLDGLLQHLPSLYMRTVCGCLSHSNQGSHVLFASWQIPSNSIKPIPSIVSRLSTSSHLDHSCTVLLPHTADWATFRYDFDTSERQTPPRSATSAYYPRFLGLRSEFPNWENA
jgi:hypothetical protein